LQEYVGGEEFKSLDSGQQNRIINIINPRLIAAKGVDTKANKNDDDKKLVILLRLNDLGVQYEESKEGLAKIEKDLDFLKDVKTATSGDKFSARQAMGNEAEKVLKNLIEEMEEKHKQLKKFQSSSNQNPKGSKNPSSFFKSPWFIGLVIAAILIASLIFYLTRNKGNNEEEVQVN
jgi:hypothetical protein